MTIGGVEPVGERRHHRPHGRRMLGEQLIEVGLLNDSARRRLERDDRRRARLPRQQRHLAEHLPFAELREQELDARVRVLAAHGDSSREDEKRRVVAASLADDDRAGCELAPPHAVLETRERHRRDVGEQRQPAEEWSARIHQRGHLTTAKSRIMCSDDESTDDPTIGS